MDTDTQKMLEAILVTEVLNLAYAKQMTSNVQSSTDHFIREAVREIKRERIKVVSLLQNG